MDKLSQFSNLLLRSHNGAEIEHRLQRLVIRTAVHALHHTRFVTDWYSSLDDPLMLRVLELHPRICEKIARPYLRCGLSYTERHRTLIAQYSWLRSHLSEFTLEAIFIGGGLKLARLDLIGLDEHRLILSYFDQFEMEGDLTLSLIREDGLRVYSLTFSLFDCGEKL